MPVPANRTLRSPLVAFRIIQGWRFILGETLTDLGTLNLRDEDDREKWLKKSRKYSPEEYVRLVPVRFDDRTWGNFDNALKDLRRAARHVALHETAPDRRAKR